MPGQHPPGYFCRPFNSGMSKKLKVGILGAGHLGRIHLQQWKEVPEAEVVGFYDPHPEKCERLVAEFGFPTLPSMEAVIDAAEAVDIVTPTTAHHRCAMAAIRAGRHVFIEKPITQTLAEADELVEALSQRGLVGQVGHVERVNPAWLAVSPALRDPMFIESHRLAQFDPRGTDVSVVLDLMIHDIDIVLSVVKSPVTALSASGVAVVSDSPDIANARIEFANGCVANVTASRVSDKAMRKVRVFQHDAYLSIDLHNPKFVCWRRLRNDDGSARLASEEQTFPQADLLLEEVRAFVDAVRTGKPPLVSGADGKRALEVALRISAGMGQAWPPDARAG